MVNFLYLAELNAIKAMLRRSEQAVAFQPASDEALAWLTAHGVPDSVRHFFAFADPDQAAESEGVFILPLVKIIDANSNVMPGVITSQFGYIVIAQTIGGDAYAVNIHCLDAEGEPPIYLINHERLGSDATVHDVRRNGRLITPTFRHFLQRFAAGTLPYDYDLREWG